MTKKALLQQVQAATKEEQKLIERILASPTSIKPSLLEALSEITKPTTRSKFLQYVLKQPLLLAKILLISI